MRNTKWLIVGLFLFVSKIVEAQKNERDSLNILIEGLVENEVESQLDWLYLLFGISIGILTIYGIIVWFWRIKKVADDRIQEKVDKIITEKLSEKTGVKLEELRNLLSQSANDMEVRKKKVLILSKIPGRKKDLIELLENAHFSTPQCVGIEHFSAQHNDASIILINNEDSKFSPEELIELFDQLKDQCRIAYIGSQVSKEIFEKYKGIVRFTNMRSYLINNLTDALKN